MGSAIGCCFDSKPKQKQPRKLIETRKMSVVHTNSYISKENIFDIYSFGDSAGAGFFSKVVQAFKKLDNKAYAIKIINKKKVSNKKYEFLNEIRILQKLDHPNIIKLYEVYENTENYYLVMEYLDGPNLSKKIEKESNITEHYIASVLYKILSAINYCHSIGICHRDIKPENIMFNEDEVKIIDFGLSKKFNSGIEKFNSFTGTPYYVAPEVIKQEYNMNCDMWSIGATAFKMFTGQPPSPCFDRDSLYEKILNDEPNYNLTIWNEYSSSAQEIVKQMLEKNPEKRLEPEQALKHSFFNIIKKEIHHSKNLDKQILQKLMKYNEQYKFKCLIMEIIVQIIEDEQITKLNRIFHAIDLNHEGFISVEELEDAFKKSGFHINMEEVRSIMQHIDLDKNGKVNYSEFLIATLDLRALLNNKRNVLTLFQYFDVDNTGFIDFNKVKKSLERKGKEVVNNEDIILMISEVSKNKGKIHLDDFKNILESFL
jgi:calcium-dependent protein kinase